MRFAGVLPRIDLLLTEETVAGGDQLNAIEVYQPPF
jgi:hypothetical protein